MFVGHFGVAFAAKRLAPRTSLATLFAGGVALYLAGRGLEVTGRRAERATLR